MRNLINNSGGHLQVPRLSQSPLSCTSFCTTCQIDFYNIIRPYIFRMVSYYRSEIQRNPVKCSMEFLGYFEDCVLQAIVANHKLGSISFDGSSSITERRKQCDVIVCELFLNRLVLEDFLSPLPANLFNPCLNILRGICEKQNLDLEMFNSRVEDLVLQEKEKILENILGDTKEEKDKK